jgi:hypothetical protein
MMLSHSLIHDASYSPQGTKDCINALVRNYMHHKLALNPSAKLARLRTMHQAAKEGKMVECRPNLHINR